MNVLIIGCGYSGQHIATLARKAEQQVHCASRRPLDNTAWHPLAINLDQPDSLAQLTAYKWDQCYYLAPPPESGEIDSRLQNFLAHFQQTVLPAILYFSTTAVYGDCDGAWVNEDTALKPANSRGIRRVNAEQQLTQYANQHNTGLTILRVAGIYGAQRLPREKLAAGMKVVKPEQSSWSNRIHVDDLAHIAFTAMQQTHGIQLYNVADSQPTTSADYVIQIAKHFRLPLPELIDRADAQQHLSPMALSFLADNKRVCNKKLLESLPVTLQYPNVASALARLSPELDNAE